jgi:hypothetical protein
LQALLLMNETQFVEAAKGMAQRAMKEGGSTPEERLSYLLRLATSRQPDKDEQAILSAAYAEHLKKYREKPETAKKLISIGEMKPDPTLNAEELASLTMVANLVLNLDEVLTK